MFSENESLARAIFCTVFSSQKVQTSAKTSTGNLSKVSGDVRNLKKPCDILLFSFSGRSSAFSAPFCEIAWAKTEFQKSIFKRGVGEKKSFKRRGG